MQVGVFGRYVQGLSNDISYVISGWLCMQKERRYQLGQQKWVYSWGCTGGSPGPILAVLIPLERSILGLSGAYFSVMIRAVLVKI